MDASFSITGLGEELSSLLEEGDFEGGEELLAAAMAASGESFKAYFHFLYGRLYLRWNKLSSSIAHLNIAAELAHGAGEQLFLAQVVDELRTAKNLQSAQRP